METQNKSYGFGALQPIFPEMPVDKLTSLGKVYCCDYENCGFTPYDYKENIYEPSTDSFLLIDALHADLHRLVQNHGNSNESTPPKTVLEVGVGSGIVIGSYSKILEAAGYSNVSMYGVDFNPKAIELAQKLLDANPSKNKVTLSESNLFENVDSMTDSQKLDVIIFNPPYVVTPAEELAEAKEKRGIYCQQENLLIQNQ